MTGDSKNSIALKLKICSNVIDDRQGARSLLITSQLPIEHWHDTLGDPTLADAILDRLLQHAHKVLLKGESMRKST